jgi:hypothetical protein
MKYSSMVIAAALALPCTANAADDNATKDDRYVDNMVECISDFIASELDASSQDTFVADCMQSKVAKIRQPAGTNRKG